jgi:hypothetical protein
LKAPVRSAGAEVLAAELLDELDLADAAVAPPGTGLAKGNPGGAYSSPQKAS